MSGGLWSEAITGCFLFCLRYFEWRTGVALHGCFECIADACWIAWRGLMGHCVVHDIPRCLSVAFCAVAS